MSTFTAHTIFSKEWTTPASHPLLPTAALLMWSPSFSKHGLQRSLVATLSQSNRHIPCWPLPPFWTDKTPSSVPPESPSTLLSCLLCKITPLYPNLKCRSSSILSLKASSLLHSDLVAGDSHLFLWPRPLLPASHLFDICTWMSQRQ